MMELNLKDLDKNMSIADIIWLYENLNVITVINDGKVIEFKEEDKA